MKKRTLALITAPCAALLAGGLAFTAMDWATEAPSTNSKPSSPAVPDEPQIFAPTDEPTESTDDESAPLQLGLDETAEWRNGVTARLSRFSTGVSGREDAPADTEYVKYTVTLDNGGEDPLDLSAITPECGNGSESVFLDGINGWLDTHLLPGKKVSWTAACSRTSGEDVQIELTPADVDSGLLYRTAIFTGTVKTAPRR